MKEGKGDVEAFNNISYTVVRTKAYLHVHHASPTTQQWCHSDPIVKYLLHCRLAPICGLGHEYHRSCSIEEIGDPFDVVRVSRDDRLCYLRFLVYAHPAGLQNNQKRPVVMRMIEGGIEREDIRRR